MMANREDRDTSADNLGEMNQRLGRELYEKDQQQHPQSRYGGYRGEHHRKWDESNFFHTGPSNRGAQDRPHQDRGNYPGGSSHSSYHTGEGAHLGDHYGSRPDSPYRNESSYLNHGYRPRPQQSSSYPSGSGYSASDLSNYGYVGSTVPGNYNEPPAYPDKIHREGPGSRSRYKEDDYRYGSGSHNWYREGRYTPDEDRTRRDPNDHRGFFQRMGDTIRDTWDDIMHADDAEYQRRHQQQHDTRFYDRESGISSRERHGSEPYRDRNFDRGYEGGPRWADETDSGRR